jgi:hypothetical protein
MEKQRIGGGLLSLAALAVAFLLAVTFPHLSGLPLALAWAATAVAFLVGLYLRSHRPKQVEKPKPILLSLEDYYRSDLKDLMRLDSETQATINGETTTLPVCCWRDFRAKTDFLGVYIPHGKFSADLVVGFSSNVRVLYSAMVEGVRIVRSMPGVPTKTSTDTFTFSGRVFVYYEDYLEPRVIADAIDAYKELGFDLELRGVDYASIRNLGGNRQAPALA